MLLFEAASAASEDGLLSSLVEEGWATGAEGDVGGGEREGGSSIFSLVVLETSLLPSTTLSIGMLVVLTGDTELRIGLSPLSLSHSDSLWITKKYTVIE